MTWSVYLLIDPRDHRIRYVGKSTNPTARLAAHLRDRSTTRKANWLRTLTAAGLRPTLTVVETGEGEWQYAETRWILNLRAAGCDLTNATDGGEGLHNPTEQTRTRIADAQRAIWNDPDIRLQRRALMAPGSPRNAAISAALRGRPHTPEHVAALPQNRSDYPWSQVVRDARRDHMISVVIPAAALRPRSEAQVAHTADLAVSNTGRPGWAKGRTLTDEERQARSAALRGRPKTPEHREKIRAAALRRWAARTTLQGAN